MAGGQESSGRRVTSKYFNTNKQKVKEEKETQELPAKRKNVKDSEDTPEPKRVHEDVGDDSVLPTNKKKLAEATPTKKLKSGSGRGIPKKSVVLEESDEDDDKGAVSAVKSAGRGGGGRGAPGRGRGGGRGGFMNFGERKDPPHKGEKVQIYQAFWIFFIFLKFFVSALRLLLCVRKSLKVLLTV